MPTVIALDVSLSMSRPVKTESSSSDFTRKHLAIHGISTLLDYFTATCKLEFTSLVVFSYLWEQLVPFTRDVDSIKAALSSVGDYSKTCFEPVLASLGSLVVDEFGGSTPTQVILVTDGSTGVGAGSLQQLVEAWEQPEDHTDTVRCPLPFPFKSTLSVVCIANPADPQVKKSVNLYERLINLNQKGGEVFLPEGVLDLPSMAELFTRVAEKYYTPYKGLLTCGHLKCNITLHPAPEPCEKVNDLGSMEVEMSEKMEVCGFMDLADIASPPTISRHLVLPLPATKPPSTETETKPEEEEDGDGKTPSFTVLLHGSLKVEGMVALTKVGPDWFGILYSWADSKKKSSLMLSLFQPGVDAVSWMGNLNYLSPIADFSEPPYGDDDNQSPFPVRPKEKRSYAQSCVVWIKSVGLQADLQKVIRHARKLPDKQQQFYKELNRVRKAALAFGFVELLEAMAAMLERECTMLPGTSHPDAALQLTHAASKLHMEMAKDASQIIMPLRTNFAQEDG
ncbi:integrator complex subunit 14-like [Mya arenaria]|uniref:integrator complex subunit 14-like n=1 Tax=Mya arenaria TaxID=6604 RepID=UPI0022DFB9EB|nr:integrator complex subunit 14-like [Mya arenaria]XP_052794375.1 integrator complex subunit 14-like [Mya arenaria]